ncbi:MAG: DapH/DapD/GlmU-related protein, partial [Candidatus Aenigmatarchaeota archaeon]
DYYFEDMNACPIKQAFEGIEYPWQALKKKDTVAKFSNKIAGKIHPTVIISGIVSIDEGTEIDPYVVIEGPVIIGKNCKIRPFALIRPGTIIGDDVVIGKSAEIKNSIIFNEAKIQSQTFVGDSICGKGVRIGSGTVIANRRFDQKNAKVEINGTLFDIGMDKYGGIIGDFVRFGANTVTSPGIMIGKYAWIYGGTNIVGFVAKEKLVKLRQTTIIVDKQGVTLKKLDEDGKV